MKTLSLLLVTEKPLKNVLVDVLFSYGLLVRDSKVEITWDFHRDDEFLVYTAVKEPKR